MSNLSNNKSVFVSGGTSGLGLAIVKYFISSGNSVVFCARNADDVKRFEQQFRKNLHNNQKVYGFTCDVSSSNAISTMFDSIKNLEINIGILICNAGVIGPMDKFLDNNKQDWAYAFNVNFYGTLNLVYETLNGMIKNGWGRIIHLSGGGAAQPLFGMTSYSASKSAAVRFIETLSLEYKDSGVTFNSIAPGILKTQLLDQMLQAGPSRIGNNLFTRALEIAGKQSDSTNKVLELIDFLTSDRGQGITGKLISAQWDAWQNWHYHIDELQKSDSFTLRRIVGKDRNMHWGDA